MVNEILKSAGFVENETYRATRFLKPPKSTYAVYMDSYTRRGADRLNLITEHSYTIEVYEYAPDLEVESRIESALDAMGVEFDKADRYWIQSEQLYQVVYTFDHVEK